MAQPEIIRLIQWLRDHGMTADQILDCIEFVESGRKE